MKRLASLVLVGMLAGCRTWPTPEPTPFPDPDPTDDPPEMTILADASDESAGERMRRPGHALP